MADLTELRTLRDALIEGLGKGVRSVRSQSGEEITYRGIREMKDALAVIERRIAALERPSKRFVTVRTTKGF